MKKVNFRMYLTDKGRADGIPSYTMGYVDARVPGLIAHRRSVEGKVWTISHIGSGKGIVAATKGFQTLREAAEFIFRLKDVATWTTDEKELVTPELYTKLCQLREAYNTEKVGAKEEFLLQASNLVVSVLDEWDGCNEESKQYLHKVIVNPLLRRKKNANRT